MTLTFNEQFIKINNINDIYLSATYNRNNNFRISPYDEKQFKFISKLKNQLLCLNSESLNFEQNLFQALKIIFIELYDTNQEYQNLVITHYNNLHYNHFFDPFDKKEKYLHEIKDVAAKRNYVISKLVGNFMEFYANYCLFTTIINQGIQLFNQYCAFQYDQINFYIVKEMYDYGIDSLIIYLKDNNPIYSIPVQIKYRTPFEHKLNIKECIEKMDNLIRNSTMIQDKIKYDGNLKNTKFLLIINDELKNIQSKPSEIWLQEHDGIYTKNLIIFDKNSFTKNFFHGFYNNKTLDELILKLENINNYCEEYNNI